MLPIGEKQRDKVKRACLQLLKENPFLHAVRLVTAGQVMNMGYPIDLKKYPGGEPQGESGTPWLSYDNVFYVLDAPIRIKL